MRGAEQPDGGFFQPQTVKALERVCVCVCVERGRPFFYAMQIQRKESVGVHQKTEASVRRKGLCVCTRV